MIKQISSFLIIFLFLFSIVGVGAQEDLTDVLDSADSQPEATDTAGSEPNLIAEQEQTSEQEQAPAEEFNADAGITPDSPLYFIDNLIEQVSVGDNPERALAYKEEKIAEAQAMIDSGNSELAEKALEKALDYGDVVETEVSPELKREVQESSEQTQYALENMKEESIDKNMNIEQNVDDVIDKEKRIDTAAELVSKIGELCNALAKLDPLQYADTCKSKDSSPKWMKQKDKELTKEQKEQVKIFFDKLSVCFENPEQCDCKGMGVQSFEDFCIAKSTSAKACMNGDEDSCKVIEASDPSDLLPSYLMPVFKQVEEKYMGSQMELHMPEECAKAGATTPKECNKIMFGLYSPDECIEAGLIGESRGDEIKCRQIMFETNTPQQCIDAGITSTDPDAPRKCSKIMFALNAPQECINAGITGESRDDQTKCANLMGGMGEQMGMGNGPRFGKDCNSIQDSAEKIKCFEEFYNNAQVNMREDFAQREFATDMGTGEKISPAEEQARQECISKGMGTILEYENGERVIICVDKNQVGTTGMMCQSQQQIESLKQECTSKGQIAMVEMRNGCPWVICTSGSTSSGYPGIMPSTSSGAGGGTGMKCPDGICDDYERMNPYACPADCGGQMPSQEQQVPAEQQEPMQPQEPVYVAPIEVPVSEQPITETPPAEQPATEAPAESGGEGTPITGEAINPFLVYWWS